MALEREKKASWRDGINQLWGAKLWSLLASMNKHLGSIAKNFEVLGRIDSIDRRLSNIELTQGKHTVALEELVKGAASEQLIQALAEQLKRDNDAIEAKVKQHSEAELTLNHSTNPLNERNRTMSPSAELAALEAEVARNTEVDGSISALVDGLAAKIEENKQDPAALQRLADHLRADNDAIVEKVRQNTPEPSPEG